MEFLYKYKEVNLDSIERLIVHDELYFPTPNQFNDPFDSKIFISADFESNEFRSFCIKNMKREKEYCSLPDSEIENKVDVLLKNNNYDDTKRHMQKSLKKAVEQLGVLCLSKKNDDLLMWAHYSDSHRGICLEFDAESNFFKRAVEVKYSRNLPVLDWFKSSDYEKAEKILVTKSEIWKNEDEWRIIETKGPDYYKFESCCLKGIIFGCETKKEDKLLIIDLVSESKKSINFYEAEKKEKEFGLDIILKSAA